MVIASARSSLFICLGYGTTLDCLRMIVAAYCVRNHNAAHDVLVDMKLMQHAALSGYCSAPLNFAPRQRRQKLLRLLTETHVSWGSCNRRLRVLKPPSHFLVGAGSHVAAMVSLTSSLDPHSSYYAIVRGMGRGWEEKNRERGEREAIVCVATNGKQVEREARLWTQEWMEAMLSIPWMQVHTSENENEDQVKWTCLLYPSLLKGGPTLKLP